MRAFFTSTVIVMLFASASMAAGNGVLPYPSKSIKEAVNRSTFAKKVEVTPSEFEFKGRNYKVHECWKESPPLAAKKKFKYFDGIAFTLEVDGVYPTPLAGKIFFMPGSGISYLEKRRLPVHTLSGIKENDFKLQVKDPLGNVPKPGETPELSFHVIEETEGSNEKN